MDDRNRGRRRLALVLIAIIAPSAAILGLGVQLLLQESRLAESRKEESLQTARADFGDALHSLRVQPPDSIVVLKAPVEDGRLRLPWTDATTPPLTGRFGRLMRAGDQAEFGQPNPRRAADLYTQARDVATSDDQLALALLSLMRSASSAGRATEADSARAQLARVDLAITDEYGTPQAFYAVVTIEDPSLRLQMLQPHTANGLSTSHQAAYGYRSLRDSLRSFAGTPAFDRLDAFVEASIASVRLQDDFASLHPQLNQRTDGVAPWLLYANDKWLLTLDPEGNLLVLDAQGAAGHAARLTALSSRGFAEPSLSSSSILPNRFLGPRFTGTYARMDRLDLGAKEPLRLRMAFIALSALLVIGLLTMGVVLIWRDSRRDMETARLRSDFVSSVSHELKTPLTSIRMYAETLRLRRQDDDVRDEYLDTIVSESGRLTRLLNNVLDFARIEKGTQRFNKAPVELQSVVETGLEALNQTIVADGFVIETNLPSDPILVDADPDALEQVVLNLISNALKYSGSAREVAVSVGRNGTVATLEVQDRGVGIASEDLPHLFEPYFRAQREDGPRISGTGLGLSIVKHTVDAHGGSIVVDSEPGHGTRVTVTLPLA